MISSEYQDKASGAFHTSGAPHAVDRGLTVNTPEFSAALVGQTTTGRDVWFYANNDYTFCEACHYLDEQHKRDRG